MEKIHSLKSLLLEEIVSRFKVNIKEQNLKFERLIFYFHYDRWQNWDSVQKDWMISVTNMCWCRSLHPNTNFLENLGSLKKEMEKHVNISSLFFLVSSLFILKNLFKIDQSWIHLHCQLLVQHYNLLLQKLSNNITLPVCNIAPFLNLYGMFFSIFSFYWDNLNKIQYLNLLNVIHCLSIKDKCLITAYKTL